MSINEGDFMISSLMFFIVALVVLPIFIGWLFLLGAPLFFGGYIFIYSVMELLGQRSLLKASQELKIGKDVFKFLSKQNSFSWPHTSTSIEISCKTGEVVGWMKQFGVREPECLYKSKTIGDSVAYPDSYDLVTDILDCADLHQLNDQYYFASKLMRRGAFFIDREIQPKICSLAKHLKDASQWGLFLVERSDLAKSAILPKSQLVSQDGFKGAGPIFLIWQKT